MFDNIENLYATNPFVAEIASDPNFFFQKGRDALNKWLIMELSEIEIDKLITLSHDYDKFKSESNIDSKAFEWLQMLLEIISYCDVKAKGKKIYNKYDDKRALGQAGVRMGHWVKNLVLFKFNTENIPPSIKNAFNYLLEPIENATVLSENHRRMIITHYLRKEYDPNSFISDFEGLFEQYNFKEDILNKENYTHLLTRIIYHYVGDWIDKKELKFHDLINKLRDHFRTEKVNFEILEHVPRQRYVWIADKTNIIGNALAHFEISFRSLKDKNIFIDIHFEGNKEQKNIFSQTIKELPENLEWIDWHDSKSIGFKESYRLDDIDIIENITIALEYLNENIGDQVRNILKELSSPHISIDIKSKNYGMKQPLNQILYGPPGTGKTYNTINKALKIINDEEVNSLDFSDRKKVKDLFDKKIKEKQIVFTTFHQNMSYEDFIEGIKPKKTDDNKVYYEIEDGVFKTICETAKNHNNSNIVRSKNSLITSDNFVNKNFFKISLGEAKNPNDREIYEYCIENNVIAIGYGGLIDFSGLNPKGINERWKELHPDDSTTPSYMNYFVNKIKIGDYIIVSNGNSMLRAIAKVTGGYKFDEDSPIRYHHFREVEWLFYDNDINVSDVYNLNFSQSTLYSLKKKELKQSFFVEKMNSDEIETNFQKNFVLIIDEINRGNVSKIFGELITLLEESKRAGKSEAITARLPYSKLEFSVPENVYILGTMNTADRSVEALDTALRRRFDFIEMMPNYNIKDDFEDEYQVNGHNAFDILRTINNRLEVLLGKDHLIGHSFFLLDEKESIESKVKSAFYKNIIPLLQEYFYGDYNKIGLVLGNGFVKKLPAEKAKKLFTGSKEFGGDDYANNSYTFKIIDYSDKVTDLNNVEFYSALDILMNKSEALETDA